MTARTDGSPFHSDLHDPPEPAPEQAPGPALRPAVGLRYLVGDWLVDVGARRLSRGAQAVVLEPRPMAVLEALCRHPGQLVPGAELLRACWPPHASAVEAQLHKVVAVLRRALGDDATTPSHIETVRKRGYRLIAPVRQLTEAGPRAQRGSWRGQSPFRGLEPFDSEHAQVFFGREDAVRVLRAALARQWAGDHPLVLLLGPSGSGKTSLVRAGLMPAMLGGAADAADAVDAMDATDAVDAADADVGNAADRANAADVQSLADLRCATVALLDLATLGPWRPVEALAGALLDWDIHGHPVFSGHSIDSLGALMRAGEPGWSTLADLLRAGQIGADARLSGGRPVAPPLLVIDRLEALFQPELQAEAEVVLGCLAQLVDSRWMLALAVCRNDDYAAVARHPLLMRGKASGAHVDLAPPDADAVARIIRLPALAAGLSFGADPTGVQRLDDRLCADAMGAPDALPLLQYTLQALYQARAPGGELTWAAYAALGRLEGAIGRRAEAVLAALPADQQAALPRLLPKLMNATPDDDRLPLARWALDAELSTPQERALVQALVDARLLVADRRGQAGGVRVAHEALLRRWPRVTSWRAQHRASLSLRAELQPWVNQWRARGQGSALLMPRGHTLDQLTAAVADAPGLFDEDERRFVALSRRRARRQARWRLAAVGGAVMLAIGATLAAISYARLAALAEDRERQGQRLASFMLGELADQLRPIGKLDLMHRIGEQGLSLFGGTRAEGELPTDLLQRARSLVLIGEVRSTRGTADPAVAVASLREAGRLLEPLVGRPDVNPAEVLRTLGASHFWLGQIAFDRGELETAQREMTLYLQASERWLVARPGDREASAELGFARNSLASIAFKRGQWAQASHWFQTALDAKLALLRERPEDEALRASVANSHFWRGLAAHARGDLDGALLAYDAAREIQTALSARYPTDVGRRRDLAVTEARRADVLHAAGRWDEAADAMDAAVQALAHASAQDAANRFWREETLHAKARLALMLIDAGRPASALMQALERELAGDADREDGGSELRQLARARLALAQSEAARRRGDPAQAAARAAEANLWADRVLRRAPAQWEALAIRGRTARGLAAPQAAGAGACCAGPAIDSVRKGSSLS